MNGLIAQVSPSPTVAEVFEYMAKYYLKRKDLVGNSNAIKSADRVGNSSAIKSADRVGNSSAISSSGNCDTESVSDCE